MVHKIAKGTLVHVDREDAFDVGYGAVGVRYTGESSKNESVDESEDESEDELWSRVQKHNAYMKVFNKTPTRHQDFHHPDLMRSVPKGYKETPSGAYRSTELDRPSNRAKHNESVELIDAISKGDTIASSEAFNSTLMTRISDLIDARRQEVAQTMFGENTTKNKRVHESKVPDGYHEEHHCPYCGDDHFDHEGAYCSKCKENHVQTVHVNDKNPDDVKDPHTGKQVHESTNITDYTNQAQPAEECSKSANEHGHKTEDAKDYHWNAFKAHAEAAHRAPNKAIRKYHIDKGDVHWEKAQD